MSVTGRHPFYQKQLSQLPAPFPAGPHLRFEQRPPAGRYLLSPLRRLCYLEDLVEGCTAVRENAGFARRPEHAAVCQREVYRIGFQNLTCPSISFAPTRRTCARTGTTRSPLAAAAYCRSFGYRWASTRKSASRFQSTRSAWSATCCAMVYDAALLFQSTRSAWSATRYERRDEIPGNNFNPRAPHGARRRGCICLSASG